MTTTRLLLKNGIVVDGTGAEGILSDVLIEDGRIKELGHFRDLTGAIEIDCTGLTVTPGFIDVHSHSDLQVLEGRQEKLLQGVTTEIVGNCGFSAFPSALDRKPLNEFAGGIFCAENGWGWTTAREYLSATQASSSVVTTHSLVGHGSLRIAQVGLRQGPMQEHDLLAMEETLSSCLSEGAVGLSTGLMYAPGSSAPFTELERLCRIIAHYGKIYTTHMRSYFGDILSSIAEQLELSRRTGCRLEISHLLIAGRKNWHLQTPVLDMIEAARDSGIDLSFDCYPYVAGSTVLTQTLPQWCLEGGLDSLLARLNESRTRSRIAAETIDQLAWDWKDILISAVTSEANAQWIGKDLAYIATTTGKQPIDVLLTLLVEERGAVNMISFNQSEENLRQTLCHPLAMIISDGFYVKGRPHPRLHGTFPRFLGKYVREQNLLPLPEAIRKITSTPAERFGLTGCGRLAPGYRADVTVFDAAKIGSDASYENPETPPKGLHLVLREGRILLHTGSSGSPAAAAN